MKTKIQYLFLWIPIFFLNLSSVYGNGITRAVVVGISDYQDEEIPDLKFAHRDAIAFADWLSSPAGDAVSKENIKLLLNEEATVGRIVEALGWLIESSINGDKAIIYFSGHGDTEQVTKFKRGYLLTHNAPPRSYMTGGVLALRDIRDIVTTLSEAGTEVVVITDACRSGALAGSKVNGSQFTSAQLATQYANEIKILSCQPEEYSSEGTQWGGGHGAFSYHLMDALYGLADRNDDYQITLSEVDRYLEDHVSKEVAPLTQTPLLIGNKRALLALVDDQSLAKRQQEKLLQSPTIASINNRSLLKTAKIADTSVIELYEAFQQALAEKRFFSPSEISADTFYQQLIKNESIRDLHSAIRRRYAAELQDDAQEALNAMLKLEPNSVVNNKVLLAEQYKLYPKYLSKSADLLGEGHYMFHSLTARSIFFAGLIQFFNHSLTSGTKSAAEKITQLYKTSLAIEPYAPHTNYYLSLNFASAMSEPDSAFRYAKVATEQAPTWILPYASLIYFYLQRYQDFESAKLLIEKCKSIDVNHPLIAQSQAALHYYQKEYDQAIDIYQDILEKDSSLIHVWNSLGVAYIRTRQFDLAEHALLKTISLDSTRYVPFYTLGFLYNALKKTEKAKKLLLQSIEVNPNFITGRKKLGVIYYQQNRYDLARDIWFEAYEIKPHDIELCLNLATVSMDLKQYEVALDFLERAFINGKRDYDEVIQDYKQLDHIPAYYTLLKKYFPEAQR